jgi:carbonic anhydrase/acetyltransferase-like protein (isoleucine patch superfamily)
MTTLVTVDGISPKVAASAWLAPDVVLTGNVLIDEEATVWFGVVARGDIEPIRVGRGSNLQDRVVLHCDPGFPLTIGAEAAVAHAAIVHGCTIGDGALVGMGAVVLTGATIGEGALIGAGALVLENTEIPPRALAVGAPARVVRHLEEDAGRSIARTYRELAAKYRAHPTALQRDRPQVHHQRGQQT